MSWQNLSQKSKTAKGNWISQDFSNSHIKRERFLKRTTVRAVLAEIEEEIRYIYQGFLKKFLDMPTINPPKKDSNYISQDKFEFSTI